MTPLAMRFAKQLTLPEAKRQVDDLGHVLPRFAELHCFECSEVAPLTQVLLRRFIDDGFPSQLMFLPAPRTWLEWTYSHWPEPPKSLDAMSAKHPSVTVQKSSYLSWRSARVGAHLEQKPFSPLVRITVCGENEDGWLFSGITPERTITLDFSKTNLDFDFDDETPAIFSGAGDTEHVVPGGGIIIHVMIIAMLALINSPKIIGRRTHMPHAGLQRRMRKTMVGGTFPLHAWTEILLKVRASLQPDISDTLQETHLTGRRALHFCRAHLRIRRGELEFVNAHWRGDASIGIKRSRYRLAKSPD